MLTINGVHICSLINWGAITITTKVIVILLSRLWQDSGYGVRTRQADTSRKIASSSRPSGLRPSGSKTKYWTPRNDRQRVPDSFPYGSQPDLPFFYLSHKYCTCPLHQQSCSDFGLCGGGFGLILKGTPSRHCLGMIILWIQMDNSRKARGAR
jgi:hypothetical protein